jgi:hypothetical protein
MLTVAIDLCNNTKETQHLYMEPSARHYLIPPGRTYRIVFVAEVLDTPQIDINGNSISVWAFANSDYRILDGEKEVAET